VRQVGFALVVVGAVFVVAELLFRLVLGPPPPPVKVYAGLQQVSTWFTVHEGRVTATYDDPNPVPGFSATGSGRVAFVGGSSVHGGLGDLPLQSEFPARVGRLTAAKALNLGQPGLDSHDLARLVEELLAFELDGVVLYTGHNDFGNAYFLARYGDVSGGVQARLFELLEGFQLFVQLRRGVTGWEGGRGKVLGVEEVTGLAALGPEQVAVTLRYLEANLRRIAWLCDQAEVPLAMVVPVSDVTRPPLANGCDDAACAEDLYREGNELRGRDPSAAAGLLRRARDLDAVPLRAPTAAQQLVRDVAVEVGAVLVDAESELPRASDFDGVKPRLFGDPVHLSGFGHKALGELLAPVVSEWVPARP